jgi:micrococcal nuclease
MYNYKAAVTRVVDGDTVIVDIDLGFGVWLKEQSVRLAKINTPELKGSTRVAGVAAKEFLSKLILNKWVQIRTEKGQEKYGRWLATILLEEDKNLIDINQKMVAEGHAVTYK